MDLASLPLRTGTGAYLAVIEASQGTRNKLKYDPRTEAFELDGVLPLGFAFPFDFGFLPSTEGGDGDPLDILVLADEPIPPSTLVPCRVVGVVEAEQRDAGSDHDERNDRVVAVASHSHRYRDCRSLDDIPPNVLDEIEGFFTYYNAQKGGRFVVLGRCDLAAAEAVIAAAERRLEGR